MKIGYQGQEGSNSERAATFFSKKLQPGGSELIPCVSSAGVINGLVKGNLDMGVLALKNTVGGEVIETQEALKNLTYFEVSRLPLHISHSLFANKEIKLSEIKAIYSHAQALKQCKHNISNLCPNAKTIEVEDTALAAMVLEKGGYPDNTGVLCSTKAGQKHGLTLIKSPFEDSETNVTTFICITLKEDKDKPFENIGAPTFIISPTLTRYFVQAIIFIAIFAAIILKDHLEWSSWDSALTISGFISIVIAFLMSKKRNNWLQQKLLSGYWKYSLSPMHDEKDSQNDQKLDSLRAVQIDSDDFGSLRVRGWREGDGKQHRWEDKGMLISDLSSKKGKFVYEYTQTNNQPDFLSLDGIVYLSWNRDNPRYRINRMSGWYLGFSTNDTGQIWYTRITKEEFEKICNSSNE